MVPASKDVPAHEACVVCRGRPINSGKHPEAVRHNLKTPDVDPVVARHKHGRWTAMEKKYVMRQVLRGAKVATTVTGKEIDADADRQLPSLDPLVREGVLRADAAEG